MTTTVLTSTGYGRSVGLRLPSASVEDARSWLPWWWHDDDSSPERLWDAPDAAACETVVRELELWVAEHARDEIFLHAGVVYVDGGAIVLPGRSYAGKSTLVAALVQRGALYGSDEYAVLAADGLVHPYPRPISLREPDGSRRRLRVPPDQVGAPAPAAVIAHLRYGTAEPAIAPLSASASILRSLDNAVAARSRPEEALTRIADATASAVSVNGIRGDADAAAEALLRLVEE